MHLDIFLVVLVLLTIIAISNIVNRFIPFIPVPLIQVALGILAASFPQGLHFELNTELFFVLFIAPLLFNDGKRTPRAELWEFKGSDFIACTRPCICDCDCRRLHDSLDDSCYSAGSGLWTCGHSFTD